MNPKDPFTPEYAIVTAGESGIGKATAVALAVAGMDVGITWYTEKHDAEDTAEEVRSHGRRAVLAQLDVGDPDAVGDVVDQLIDDLGGVDVFVNNAGMGVDEPLSSRRSSTTGGTRRGRSGRAVPLPAAGGGRHGRAGPRRSVDRRHQRPRTPTRSRLQRVRRRQARPRRADEDHRRGAGRSTAITANAVAPGEIATPMTNQKDVDPHSVHRPGVPLGRPGDAREVAAVIAFLASSGGGLCHRRVLGRRRRHAGDGTAGRLGAEQ